MYSFKEGSYVNVPPPGNTITLFEFEGTSIHIDTQEAKDQIAAEKAAGAYF
jgi:dynein intermediate chain 1, axonemal